MQDAKLIQMLLTTMVTSQNINFAISNFANKGGTIENERNITIAAIKGTLVGFLATLAISFLLANWKSYQHHKQYEAMHIEVDMEDNDYYEVASMESISDDDDDSTLFSSHLSAHQDIPGDEVSEMESSFDDDSDVAESTSWISSPRKSSLRLALRKHQGWGTEWKNSGERHSLRFCSPSYISS